MDQYRLDIAYLHDTHSGARASAGVSFWEGASFLGRYNEETNKGVKNRTKQLIVSMFY